MERDMGILQIGARDSRLWANLVGQITTKLKIDLSDLSSESQSESRTPWNHRVGSNQDPLSWCG
jgi:hypothetical protein